MTTTNIEYYHFASQPAGKKRKLNKHEYKRVLAEKKEARKRERMEVEERKQAERRIHPIFNSKRRKLTPEEDNRNEEEPETETR